MGAWAGLSLEVTVAVSVVSAIVQFDLCRGDEHDALRGYRNHNNRCDMVWIIVLGRRDITRREARP